MSDVLQPDLFSNIDHQPPEEEIDVIQRAAQIAASAMLREDPYVEQKARNERILKLRDKDLGAEQKAPALETPAETELVTSETGEEEEMEILTVEESQKLARKHIKRGAERAERPTLFEPDDYKVS